MEVKIGPVLKKKQSEWVELLTTTELKVDEPKPIPLSGPARFTLAALWFEDALKGRTIYYPQTEWGVFFYRILRSELFLFFYTCVSLLHMSVPYMVRPSCPWQSRNDSSGHHYRSSRNADLYLPQLTTLTLRFCCILVYFFEVGIQWAINFRGLPTMLENKWVLFRFFASCLLIIGALQEFNDPHAVTNFYCLVPFMYITRRKSLRDMSRGVFLGFQESIPILIFLFFVMLFFSFIGFLVFSNVDTPDGTRSNFDTLAESWLTCLHSFSARGFTIYALDPYFTARSTSALFFVCLSVTADLLCAALIIATGNRQFRVFANKVFQEQLLARKRAIIHVHRCLAGYFADTDENVKIEGGKPTLEGNDLPISCDAWLAFTECVDKAYAKATLQKSFFQMECNPNTETVDCAGMCRLCVLLGSRFNITGDVSDAVLSLVSRRSEIVRVVSEERNAIEMLPPSTRKTEDGRESSVSFPSRPGTLSRMTSTSSVITTSPMQSDLFRVMSTVTQYYTRFQRTCVSPALRYSIHVPNYLGGTAGMDFNVMKSFEVIIRLMLIGQLVNICRPNDRQRLFTRLGFVLEALFWLEAILNSIDRGFIRYCREVGYGYLHVINVITLVLMIRIGKVDSEAQANDSDFIFLVVLQSIRIIRFFKLLRDSNQFNSILPLLFRVVVLVTSVIYFFAVFAHNRFCNTLQEDAAEGNDDIAGQWIQYSNILNFETFPLAMFTLFEIAILGNWSMVMRASAQISPVDSLIFFYVYRLTMALVVLPLLSSFIIQAFISRKDAASGTQAARKTWEKNLMQLTIEQKRSSQRKRESSTISQYEEGKAVVGIQSDDIVSNSMMSFWSVSGTEAFAASPEVMKKELIQLQSELKLMTQKCSRLKAENDSLAAMNDVLIAETKSSNHVLGEI